MSQMNRRFLLAGAAGLAGSALAPWRAMAQQADSTFDPRIIYAAMPNEPFPVPAINLRRIGAQFLRAVVNYDGAEAPGTIVIDPAQHHLFLVNGDGTAIRYGVGVGRQGFLWSGGAEIKAKREWPDWYPPKEMLARDPSIMKVMSKLQSGIGMAGGPGNPLGARAMYLYQGNKDTLYRIHGTVEPWTIGTSVSSGCIRMINQDVIDLFGRVPVNTQVHVLGDAQPSVADNRRRYAPDQGAAVPDEPEPASHRVMYPDQDPYFGQHSGPDYDPYADQY